MGTWDIEPWDNDTAADWYHNTFKETKFADRVREALNRDVEDWQYIRAAAYILVQLGRVYIWPIYQLEDDLALAVEKTTEIRDAFVDEDDQDELGFLLDAELRVLEERLSMLRQNRHRLREGATQPRLFGR